MPLGRHRQPPPAVQAARLDPNVELLRVAGAEIVRLKARIAELEEREAALWLRDTECLHLRRQLNDIVRKFEIDSFVERT